MRRTVPRRLAQSDAADGSVPAAVGTRPPAASASDASGGSTAGSGISRSVDVSYQSYLPSLVAREQLIEGNSKLEVSRSGGQLAGPGIAGGLVEALTAPLAVLVDAISFLGSAIFLFRIRTEERAPSRAEREAGAGMKAEVKEGLRWVLGNR